MLLSKEASNKDTQLKSQLLMSFTDDDDDDDDDDESKGGEKIWIEFGFFGNQRAELTIQKANFPENSFIYVNQATVSLVKGGEKAIYCDYVICAQITPMANPDSAINFDTYLILYCYMKSSLPNIFSCTVFKKPISLLMDQNENKIKSSGLFFFLLSTLDRKEEIIQWRGRVHLHSVDLSIDNLIEISGLTNINPALLESNQREKVLPGYYKIMKKTAEISNQNFISNSHAYLSAGGKTDPDIEFLWIDDSLKTSVNQFQLTY